MDIDSKVPNDVKKYTYQSMLSFYLIEAKEGFDVKYSGKAPHPVIKFNEPNDRFSNTVEYNPSYTYAPKKAKEEPQSEPVADESPKEKVEDKTPTIESDNKQPNEAEADAEKEEILGANPEEKDNRRRTTEQHRKTRTSGQNSPKKPIKDNYTPRY